MARYDDDEQATGDDWRALDGQRPQTYRSDEWQRLDTSGEEDEAKQPWSRRTKLTIVGFALVAVFVTAVIVLQWFRNPRPACILLAGAHYDINLLFPPNVLGWKGLHEIDQWAEKQFRDKPWLLWREYKGMRPVGSLADHELTQDNTWQKVTEKLREFRDAKFDEKTVVVFLSMFGATDAEDQPVLFADDKLGKTTLPVQTVIDSLKKIQEKSEETKNIVLLLDVVPVENHWQLGIFGNSFVAGLKKLKLPPDMYVICSCDENQRSWASEELQRTIFAHYVFKGLRGAASDRAGKTVKLSDLFEYVEKNVQNWALGNRDMVQTPILLTSGDPDAVEKADKIDLARPDSAAAEPADVAEVREFKGLSPKLVAAWGEWKKLKDGASWTYAPQLWRQYQDALLRWEYLERTDCTPAERLVQLGQLVKQNGEAIENAQTLKFADSCLSNAIPVAAAFGSAANVQASSLTGGQLWSQSKQLFRDKAAPENDKTWLKAKAAWSEALKKGAGRSASVLSYAVDELLETADASEAEFRRAADLIEYMSKIVQLDDDIRPIEAHFLVMLDKCAPPTAPDRLAESQAVRRDALALRRLAEQTIFGVDAAKMPNPLRPTYCEFVFPFLKSSIEKADEKRRAGEDRLFGDQPQWAEAKLQLKNAHDDYRDVQKKSKILRAAVAARDRGWAELPYYALWLSCHPVSEIRDKKITEGEEELKRGMRLLDRGIESLDELTRELGKAVAGAAVKDAKAADLQKRAAALNDSCDELAQHFKALNKPPVIQADQLIFHQIESLLSLPAMSGELRNERIGQSRNITAKLQEVHKEHKAGVQRRNIRFAETQQLEDVARRLYALAIEGEEKLFKSLERLPDKIAKGLKDSAGDKDLDVAKEKLRGPADYSRMIPGGRVAENEREVKPFTAPEAWRRLHAHDMLLFLAERTYLDHWYQADGVKPYYQNPAVAYAKAAEILAEGKTPIDQKEKEDRIQRKRTAAQMVEKINQPGSLTVAALIESPPLWTTEPRFHFQWEIRADDKLPRGVPMAWKTVAVGSPAQAKEKAVLTPREPLEKIRTDLKDKAEYELLESAKPAKGLKTVVRLEVLYRGQRRSEAIEVKSQEPSLIVQHFMPPSTSHMAVRMDKILRYEAVSIVLDTSGSMKNKYPTEYIAGKMQEPVAIEGSSDLADRRYDKAMLALDDVLKRMTDIRYLSILTFQPAGEKTSPEFLERVTRWDSADDKRRSELIKKLRAQGLNNWSPIVDGIEKSMRDGFPRSGEYDGPKLVIVLSDGGDNHSARVKENADAKDFFYTESRKHKDNKDISVAVICFVNKFVKKGMKDKDYEKADEQFGPERQAYDRYFQVVEKDSDLSTAIKDIIRPRLQLEAVGRTWEGEREVSLPEGNLNWGDKMFLGGYHSSIQGRKIEGREFKLSAGQNLLLTLGPTPPRAREKWFDLDRAVIAEQPETLDFFKRLGHEDQLIRKKEDWFATLYQSERVRRTGKLEQLVLLEKARQPGGLISQPKPNLVWLKVDPATAGDKKGLVRWHNDCDWPAPAVRLHVNNWPAGQPTLGVWWNELALASDGIVAKDLHMDPRGQPLPFKLQHSSGVIERLEVEEQTIEIAPDKFGKENCLAFRVQHDPGKKVQIRLNTKGWSGGEDHRYFESIDKGPDRYTAYFYPWTAVAAKDVEFKVICIESFKAAAHSANFSPKQDISKGAGDLFHKRNPFDRVSGP